MCNIFAINAILSKVHHSSLGNGTWNSCVWSGSHSGPLFSIKTQCYVYRNPIINLEWWRHGMETFSALLVIWEGNPSQRPVTWSFDVFFDLRLNQRLGKQSRRPWFETPPRSLRRHCNVRWLDGCLRFIMGIHIPIKRCLLSEKCDASIYQSLHVVLMCKFKYSTQNLKVLMMKPFQGIIEAEPQFIKKTFIVLLIFGFPFYPWDGRQTV